MAARWMWLVLALVGASACTRSFVPITPRVARGSGVALALARVQVAAADLSGSDLTLELAVSELSPGMSLSHISVSDAREPRCLGGTRGEHVHVLPGGEAARELVAGDRLLARFPSHVWRDAQSIPLRVDVVLSDRAGALTCATVPLVDAAPELAYSSDVRWSFGFGVSVQSFLGELELDSAVLFPVVLGRWFGPVRASLSVAPGAAQCPERVCPVSGGEEGRNEPLLPIALGVDTGRSFGALRLGIAGAYRIAFTRVHDARGQHNTFFHGPVLTPRLGLSLPEPSAPGLPGGERIGGFVGLELPVSYNWDDHAHHGLGLGCSLSFVVPL
jgi:hypothetical protein